MKNSEVRPVERLVISHRRKYITYWKECSDWYWLFRLFQEVLELAGSLIGLHKHKPEDELKQIASICINWLGKRMNE